MHDFEIIRIINTPIASNCFLIIDSGNRSGLIIDPGSEDSISLVSRIESHELKIDYIILTHEHFDHILGVNFLKQKFNPKIICSKECADKIIDRRKNLSEFYNQIGFETCSADIAFDSNNLLIDWNGVNINLIKTKGHSEGSICIIINNSIFTGDTIIKDTKTVLKLPDSSRSDLVLSLELIKTVCNDHTNIFPGHGDSFRFIDFISDKCF